MSLRQAGRETVSRFYSMAAVPAGDRMAPCIAMMAAMRLALTGGEMKKSVSASASASTSTSASSSTSEATSGSASGAAADSALAPRRRLLRALALPGVVGASGVAGLVQAVLAADGREGFREIRGEVTVDGKPARPGQRIGSGQAVVTGTGARAVYVIGEDAFLQHENSRFAWRRGRTAATLRYLQGRVLSVFGKGRKRIETPTATIGIRGTGCYIEAAPEQTYFCLCYGTVEVVPKADPAQAVSYSTEHHENPVIIGSTPGTPMMEKTRVINHSDDELVMLEALVGRKPPFWGKTYDDYY